VHSRHPLPADMRCSLASTCRRRTEPRTYATCIKNLVKVTRVVLEISLRTDRHIDHWPTYSSQYFATAPAGEVYYHNACDCTFITYTILLYAVHEKMFRVLYFVHNYNKLRCTVISSMQQDSNAKQWTQQMSTSPNNCCHYTLQNEIITVLLYRTETSMRELQRLAS